MNKRSEERGTKKQKQPKKRSAIKAALVEKTADVLDCDESLVYKVLRGNRKSEAVLAVYMELSEGENKLLEAVKTLIPFDRPRNVELRVRFEEC